ncbi:MAG: alpha-glucosidase [Verrucomicrobia bacterium]|nr:alpha-glucosidase [Verrucomicrobiota bacterium]
MTKLNECTIYQIYPMSFQDSTGTGMGDLNGIRQRLDYLSTLGVNMLWLTPIYRSPKRDNGYDVADYRTIDPDFGSLSEMEALIAEASERGIGIMMDIVANHTSTEHEWFQRALAGDSHYQAFYVFRDQAFVDAHPVGSVFGGNAWEYVPELDRYYLHNFDPSQADLDWENPAVRSAMADVLNFWIGKGIQGFRFDVIDMVSKDWQAMRMSNGPRLHDYIRELNRASFGGQEIVTVGETWGADLDHMRHYSNPVGDEFSMVFNFEHLGLGCDKWQARFGPQTFKQVVSRLQPGLHGQGWNSLFLGNHDLPRVVSYAGNDDPQWRDVSAKQWAILLHMLQGTPFIYQGEELGMTNRHWQRDELRDVEAINYCDSHAELGGAELSDRIDRIARDNARTPMQWDASEYAGFSDAPPWIPVNENYRQINAELQVSDPSSVFHCYRQLIALRKQLAVIGHGDFSLLDAGDPERCCYVRVYRDPETGVQQRLLVLANLSECHQEMPHFSSALEGKAPLISNYQDAQGGGGPSSLFRPYETAAWLLQDP